MAAQAWNGSGARSFEETAKLVGDGAPNVQGFQDRRRVLGKRPRFRLAAGALLVDLRQPNLRQREHFLDLDHAESSCRGALESLLGAPEFRFAGAIIAAVDVELGDQRLRTRH